MKRQRIRPGRLLVVVITVLLLAASALYYVIQRGKLSDARLAADKTLLATLATTVMVLSLALGVLLIRNLVRVLAGWRRGVIGSRLQARVALAFLLLVLAPTLILSGAAIGIVRRTLSDLAPPSSKKLVDNAAWLAGYVERQALGQALQATQKLATQLEPSLTAATVPNPREMARRLGEARAQLGLTAAGYISKRAGALAVADVPRDKEMSASINVSELSRIPDALPLEALRRNETVQQGERMAWGWRAIAVVPLGRGQPGECAVWGAVYLPERLADRIESVNTAQREIGDLTLRREPLEDLNVSLFVLVTLVVLFAAVWTGFFLARQLTDPILELARGTEALARGELSYRVRERGNDEIAHLTRGFNRMAAELERARRDLEARRVYIETLLETAPIGVVSLDALGRVTTVNRTALEVLHVDSLPVGADPREALGPSHEALVAAVRPVAEGRMLQVTTEVVLKSAEGPVPVEVTAERFAMPGRGAGVLVILSDLTQLRRAERHAAWGEVARRVAHEIKNPLTPIRLSAERLLRRFRRDPRDAAPIIEESVATIVREVESLRHLVNEFSRFGRMPEIQLAAGDLGQVAAEAVRLYEGAHPGVQFELDLETKLPPHRLDAEALRRVVINLLDNAVAAVGEHGVIRVRTGRHDAHRTVRLEVIDNGPGLSDDDRQQLFLPTFSRRPGGTGLGLAIVHRIVTEHGGLIRAEANSGGQGTRMVVELPTFEESGHD